MRLFQVVASAQSFNAALGIHNTLLTRDGALTGLLTTEGFEDTLLITRGAYGRWGGLSEEVARAAVRELLDAGCVCDRKDASRCFR